jgi:vacuolar-type H+-ATPase subunit E/Vma4
MDKKQIEVLKQIYENEKEILENLKTETDYKSNELLQDCIDKLNSNIVAYEVYIKHTI